MGKIVYVVGQKHRSADLEFEKKKFRKLLIFRKIAKYINIFYDLMKKVQNCQILQQNREPREKSTAYVSLIILNGARLLSNYTQFI